MHSSSHSQAPRLRSHGARLALAGALGSVAVLATPGIAAAAGSANDLTPLRTCVTDNGDGTRTAVFGYDNPTGATITVPHGNNNKMSPRTYTDVLPTTFEPGLHRGAFSLTVSNSDPTWTLGDDSVSAAFGLGPACPTATELPGSGNGTGAAIGLVAAGVVGAVMVQRVKRRAVTATEARTGPEPDDA